MMQRSDTPVVAGVGLILGMAALLSMHSPQDIPDMEEPVVEEIEYLPLNGTFQCEYYGSKAQQITEVVDYEVFPDGGQWLWNLTVKDGTTLFYTQGTDKFCYVRQEDEE